MYSNKIVALCPHETVTIEPSAYLIEKNASFVTNPVAEDAVEEMVVCLAAIEAAWAAGEFRRLSSTLASVVSLAGRAGLPDVAGVAKTAAGLIEGRDDVALAAVVARLVRTGESSLAALLEISYRQI